MASADDLGLKDDLGLTADSGVTALLLPRLDGFSPLLAPVSGVESLLAAILNWVSDFELGSILAAPFVALRVLLRALASAGRGLLAPALLLSGMAVVMTWDRKSLGTKSA
jgi:hypothetical protein